MGTGITHFARASSLMKFQLTTPANLSSATDFVERRECASTKAFGLFWKD
jgi:hypothetical protein